jgi:hypothetical protein
MPGTSSAARLAALLAPPKRLLYMSALKTLEVERDRLEPTLELAP